MKILYKKLDYVEKDTWIVAMRPYMETVCMVIDAPHIDTQKVMREHFQSSMRRFFYSEVEEIVRQECSPEIWQKIQRKIEEIIIITDIVEVEHF